ncbi:ABC transporter substrate-binding protein [Streptosporangium lutulentum]|uniref:ABC transporter substrate-binding protein n=1 Tax=Streptosporangium lutulentum TaxID=1461250 RepID=UPI0027D7C008|nr:ABC transporter substrate-binding protein [Streptosporangium lutulentum]
MAVALSLAGLLSVAACGGNDPADGKATVAAPAQQKDQGLYDLLPDKIKQSGTLNIAAGHNYPPLVFLDTDNTSITGLEPELMKAIGQVMGVKVTFNQASFDSLIAGVQARRYDLAVQAMLDTPERRGKVTFVDYFKTSSSLLVQEKDAASVASLDDLCGKVTAVEQGTAQVDDAQQQAKKCSAAGKAELKVLVFPDTVGCIQAVSTGRANAFIGGTPTVAYQAGQSGGQMKQVGQPYRFLPYGILVNKEDQSLVKAVQGALQELMDNGSYAKILTKWQVSSGALDKAMVDGGSA